MPPYLRKATLLIHILASVGWIGAVAAFLTLVITGLVTTDPQIVRAVYIAMTPVTRYIIVPLAFASLASGVTLSLGTPWGLLRHYWIIFKLIINLLSLPILLLHTTIIYRVAAAAITGRVGAPDLRADRLQLVVAASVSLAALLVAAILSVYKPRGKIAYKNKQ